MYKVHFHFVQKWKCTKSFTFHLIEKWKLTDWIFTHNSEGVLHCRGHYNSDLMHFPIKLPLVRHLSLCQFFLQSVSFKRNSALLPQFHTNPSHSGTFFGWLASSPCPPFSFYLLYVYLFFPSISTFNSWCNCAVLLLCRLILFCLPGAPSALNEDKVQIFW